MSKCRIKEAESLGLQRLEQLREFKCYIQIMKALPPILSHKKCGRHSLFLPENLLREAKRQKSIPDGQIPSICILDPDGDITRNLLAENKAPLDPYWACYHTQLYDFEHNQMKFGIVPSAVGASFAVLIAEELFVSGCQLLISITSSGQVKQSRNPPFFMMIERAYRDEGTSYHYLPPADYVGINDELLALLKNAFSKLTTPFYLGATWTTDAPFRETSIAIDHACSENILAVEMEAAALYAFAKARNKAVACFAHVTNQMATIDGDFEKGEAVGTPEALALITAVCKEWLENQ